MKTTLFLSLVAFMMLETSVSDSARVWQMPITNIGNGAVDAGTTIQDVSDNIGNSGNDGTVSIAGSFSVNDFDSIDLGRDFQGFRYNSGVGAVLYTIPEFNVAVLLGGLGMLALLRRRDCVQ